MPERLLQSISEVKPLRGRRQVLRSLCSGIAALAAGSVARAQARTPDAALLVASTDLVGSIFARSVVLVRRVPAEETIGVILNRPGDEPPPAGLSLPEGGGRLPGTYRGGPLARGSPFAIGETENAVEATLDVGAGVRFATGSTSVGALLIASRAARSKLFAGYAGWAPGQLAQEISAGYWRPRSVSPELLFDPHPASQWQRLESARQVV
jgi:putative transcriptional regulator